MTFLRAPLPDLLLPLRSGVSAGGFFGGQALSPRSANNDVVAEERKKALASPRPADCPMSARSADGRSPAVSPAVSPRAGDGGPAAFGQPAPRSPSGRGLGIGAGLGSLENGGWMKPPKSSGRGNPQQVPTSDLMAIARDVNMRSQGKLNGKNKQTGPSIEILTPNSMPTEGPAVGIGESKELTLSRSNADSAWGFTVRTGLIFSAGPVREAASAEGWVLTAIDGAALRTAADVWDKLQGVTQAVFTFHPPVGSNPVITHSS